ncbi:efflux RND transporter permease subunit, partial [Sulfurimonas sp.]|uniref:efflux RND transporter permease subunit n=1 Tax=Sulfurimonas sp. TaxID=2022749 RepID=UPI0025F115A7
KTKVEKMFDSFYNNTIGRLVTPYVGIIKFSNGKFRIFRRILLTVGVILLLGISLKNIMPTIGKDAMPPMDTGIIKAQVAFSANETVESAEEKIKPILKWLHEQKWVKMSSVAFGTEPGVLSLGSGNLPAEATLTINCINRFDREETIWELEDIIREKISHVEGVKRNDVFDFGATALSSIKATVDVRLSSAVVEGLSDKSYLVKQALSDVAGLTSVSTSWDKDFMEVELSIDENKALSYGITPYQIAMQLPIKGEIIGLNANLESMNTQFVRLYLKGKFSQNIETLRLLPIATPMGEIPLSHIASLNRHLTFAKIERDKMLYSLDVNGYRSKRPVTHLTDDTIEALKSVKLNDVIVEQTGDIAQLNDSFKRMIKAIGLGVIILTMVLIAIYRSVRMALIMILVLPLSLIGAAWGMLIFEKPSCMPSLLGILLLFGIIIKNAVLLIDFYQNNRESGEGAFESAIEAVKVRFRPVMMTAFATSAGMIPIALEQAVGLERLSPLADVAIGGVIVGTLLTLIYVPMFAYIFDKDKSSDKAEKAPL